MKQNKPQVDEHGILTDEVRHQITHSFYSQYEGRGMSPAEIMQIHGDEFWQDILKAQHQATLDHLAQVTDAELAKQVADELRRWSIEQLAHWFQRQVDFDAEGRRIVAIFAAREAKEVEQARKEEHGRGCL